MTHERLPLSAWEDATLAPAPVPANSQSLALRPGNQGTAANQAADHKNLALITKFARAIVFYPNIIGKWEACRTTAQKGRESMSKNHSDIKCKALIVDNDRNSRKEMQNLLRQDFDHLFESIDTAATLTEARKYAASQAYDLCFLDIQLGRHNGFDLLPALSPKTRVIFITANSDFAIQAIKVRAFDYILKPLNPAELQAALVRFEAEVRPEAQRQQYLLIKDHGKTTPILLHEIEYLEAQGAYSVIHTVQGNTFMVSKTLKALAPALGDKFIRIHKSYVVNRQVIKAFNKDSLTTIRDTMLPVSRVGAKELHRHF